MISNLARLEEARRRSQEQLEQQQRRLNERFDRMQQRMERQFGNPSATQQRIVATALEMLGSDGLNALSLRKLAARLGMQASALYWHFKSKDDLVDHMAEAILGPEFAELKPKLPEQAWQDWLTAHMTRLRQAMLTYPDGARVVAGARLYPAVTLAKSFECGLISLTSGGLTLAQARGVMITATTYTFGYVIEEQAAPTPEQLAQFDLAGFLKDYPYLAESLRHDDFKSPEAQDEKFQAGLHYIMNGVTA